MSRNQLGAVQAIGNVLMPWMNGDSSRAGSSVATTSGI
jgi:hypothetical protein